MNKKNNVCAIIIAFNDYISLNRCIKSLLGKVSYICVVDNSTYTDKLTYNKEEIIYIKNTTNIGLGGALNIGIKKALKLKIDWVLLLDQDSIIEDNMINNMINSFENSNDENIGQIVPVVYDKNTSTYLPSLSFSKFSLKKIYKPKKNTFIDFQITSGSLIKKEVFNNIGYKDEHFFIDYIDFDYCFRLRTFGYKILLSKDALMFHSLGEKSTKAGVSFIQHSSERIFYQVRNRLILMKRFKKNFPFFIVNESKNMILKFFKIIILEDEKKQKLINYFKGLIDGLFHNEKIK